VSGLSSSWSFHEIGDASEKILLNNTPHSLNPKISKKFMIDECDLDARFILLGK
jgi:hypothetical protein